MNEMWGRRRGIYGVRNEVRLCEVKVVRPEMKPGA
jgi:hypothetical protein